MKPIFIKPIINKANGQCNFSIPKKKMPKKLRDKIGSIDKIEFLLRGWD